MKKFFLIIAVIFTTMFSSFAEDEKVPVVFNNKKQTSSKSTWDRAPMRIPVDVFYNTENRVIKVEGSETIEAEIYLYNLLVELN